jgi:WD40 repeat protein
MTSSLLPGQIVKYGSRLLGQELRPGLPHRWQQNRAIRKLVQDGSSAAVQVMALAVVNRSLDDDIRQNLITALKSMRENRQLKEIAEIAIKINSKKLFSLVKEADYLPLEPLDRRVAIALACGYPERLANDGAEVVPKLLAAWKDTSTSQSAEIALLSLRATTAQDAICMEWFNKQQEIPELLEIIKKIDHLPRQATKLRVTVALACEWPERLADDGPEVGQALHEALKNSLFPEAAVAAIGALQSPAAIDTLCRCWMETGAAGDELATLLLSANHSPSEPAERALFWLLSEQMQRYEELDLDGTLLVQAQAAASTNVRKRLAAAAAASGRTEWLSAMQQCKPLSHFDTGDWTTTVELLKRAGDPNAIWHWALKAPPVHAQELLQAVPTGSRRNAEIREASSGLQSLASQLPEVPDRHYLLTNFCTHTLSGHDDRVRSIAWSPDGRCLASGSYGISDNGTIRLWDPASGTCTHTLSGHSDGVRSIAWSPDGRCLASGSSDHTIRLWDPASGACTHTLSGHSHGVDPISWSPDGRCLASGSSDNTIRLWDPASGTCTHTLSGHSNSVWSIAWSPDGRFLASCSRDHTIRFWNPSSGACTHTLSGHSDGVRSIAWSPDGRCIASGCNNSNIQLWGNDFSSLLTIPVASYASEQWKLLSTLQDHNKELDEWKRPWLEFISALSSLIRRFDVSLDNQASKPASSEFEIEIDG